MTIPKHIREEIIEMLPYPDFDDYLKFVPLHYNEFVTMGVFLKDVKFTDLTLKAQRKVFFSAARLWIAARKGIDIGIM